MKPELLVMRAFGAYPGEETVDFRKLGDKALLLIYGPTGGGKSTLLDAMCVALYGESSGGERTGRQMRSDHAAVDTQTEVAFTFLLGKDRYLAQRIPEQERPKKRSAGMTRQANMATLSKEVVEGGLASWKVIADGWNDVTAKVTEIFGFDVVQFRQVEILPQGKFEDFLKAGSQAREDILESLFHTSFFGAIEQALMDRARALEAEVGKVREEVTTLHAAAGVESGEELTATLSALEGDIARLKDGVTALQSQEDAARDACMKAQTVQALFDELAAAQVAQAALCRRADEMRITEEVLANNRKAAQLDDVVSAARQRRHEHGQAIKALNAATETQTAAGVALAQASQTLAAEEGKAPERERLAGERATLTALREKVGQLGNAGARRDAAVKAKGDADGNLKAARMDLEVVTKQIERTQADQTKDAVLAGKAGEATLLLRQKTALQAKLSRLGEMVVRAKRGDEVVKQDKQAVRDAEKAHNEAEKAHVALDARWRKHHAVVLAKSLDKGQPCSVCGSKSHPDPARGRADSPSDGEMDDAASVVKEAAKHLADARDTHTKSSTTLAGLKEKIDELKEELGEDAKVDADVLIREIAAAKREQGLADEAKGRLAGHEEALKEAGKQKLKLEATIKVAENASSRALAEASGAEAELKALEVDLPPAYRTGEALEGAIVRVGDQIEKMDNSLKAARNAAGVAESGLARAQAALEAAAKAEVATKTARGAAEQSLQERLRAAGFTDESVLAAARIPDEVQAHLDSEASAYKEATAGARDRLQRAEAVCAGQTVPDTARFLETHTAAQAATRDARQRLSTGEERLRSLKEIGGKVQTALVRVRRAEEQYAVVGSLAKFAHGDNPHRMSLHRYVLSSMLDSVLSVASRNFMQMSNGRYLIKRRADVRDQRAHAGLDLAVLDHYTGGDRDVVTLSGGEKFLAALSLALALAEVVQGYAGGIRLESVFVDEGFGSLDDDTLDRAMQVFGDMREKGRLVGIISHVAELRERIDAKLEVISTRDGSSTQFHL
jgi:exonuclease SbcC